MSSINNSLNFFFFLERDTHMKRMHSFVKILKYIISGIFLILYSWHYCVLVFRSHR